MLFLFYTIKCEVNPLYPIFLLLNYTYKCTHVCVHTFVWVCVCVKETKRLLDTRQEEYVGKC